MEVSYHAKYLGWIHSLRVRRVGFVLALGWARKRRQCPEVDLQGKGIRNRQLWSFGIKSRHLTAARKNNCLRMFNERCIWLVQLWMTADVALGSQGSCQKLMYLLWGIASCVELTEDNKGGVQFRKTNYTFAEVGSK